MSQHDQQQLIEMAQCLGRIEGKLDSLSGPEGRITKLEAAQERHWWYTMCVAPVLVLGHGLARKFGVNI